MDKLQPVLAHKFWILLGVALLLPTYGWWSTTGTLVAEIDERVGKIDSSFQNAKVSGAEPNAGWAAELKKINLVEEDRYKQAAENLWMTQKYLMTWPNDIAPFMRDIPYRAELDNSRPLTLYRVRYQEELAKLWRIARPFDPRTGQGQVVFEWNTMPQVPRETWAQLPPNWSEMWDAQEDIWLLTDLLASIARVNDGAETIKESVVKEIRELRLLGGNRNAMPNTGGGGGGAEGGPAAGEPPAMMFGRGGRGADGPASVDFDPATEFGSAAEGGAAGGGEPGAPATEGFGQKRKNERRYVDDDEKLPYRTRAFYLKVIMDHTKVPEFVTELTHSRWPVEVVRIHQADIHREDIGVRGGAGGRPGGGDFGAGAFAPRMARPAPGADGPVSQNATNLIASAMADPYLAEVVVAGLMTLYKAPPTTEPAPGAEAQPAASPQEGAPADVAGEPPVAEATGEAATAPAETDPPAAAASPAAPASDAPAETPAENPPKAADPEASETSPAPQPATPHSPPENGNTEASPDSTATPPE